MLAHIQHLLAETLRSQCMAGVRIPSVYAPWVISGPEWPSKPLASPGPPKACQDVQYPLNPLCNDSVLSISVSPIYDLQLLNSVKSPDHRRRFHYAHKPTLLSIALGSQFTAARAIP